MSKNALSEPTLQQKSDSRQCSHHQESLMQKIPVGSQSPCSSDSRNSNALKKKSAISFQDRASFRSDNVQIYDTYNRAIPDKLSFPNLPRAKVHFKNKNIALVEDVFGTIYDENSIPKHVRRFTWKNHNNIEVQIINYGARITSIKLPDKHGDIEDVVLGFDCAEGYIQNEQHLFGATIGRVTGPIENSTFVIDGKQHWINSNDGKHHTNGGHSGLDKLLWQPTVRNSKVILSYTLPAGHEGFDGELLVEITYELSNKNEFSVSMEARCTKPTIVNLSNLCYFNLGGHGSGVNQLHKHIVTINSSNYIVKGNNNFPTGKIERTAFTECDFQIPKLLKKILSTGDSNIGFDQYFCIDTDGGDDIRFVGRAIHVPSGRTLEIYSNQHAVRFTVENQFDIKNTLILRSGLLKADSALDQLLKSNFQSSCGMISEHEKFLLLVEIYQKLKDLQSVDENNFKDVLELFQKLHSCSIDNVKTLLFTTDLFKEANIDFKFFITAIIHAINIVKSSIPASIERMEKWKEIKNIIDQISDVFNKLDESVVVFTQKVSINYSNKEISASKINTTLKKLERDLELSINTNINRKESLKSNSFNNSKENLGKITVAWLWEELLDRIVKSVLSQSHQAIPSSNPSLGVARMKTSTVQNTKMLGKKGASCMKYAGMAFQTQNYPNAVYHKNFPNTVLRPNEVYRHKILYSFWIQSGSPKKWLKRYSA